MLKWVIGLVSFLVVIMVVPLVVGMFLPREHRAVSSITLRQPQDTVWAVIRALDRYPTWWSAVGSMTRVGGDTAGPETWLQRDKRGRELPLEVVEAHPPERMVTRIADEKLPFGGRWIYVLESVDGSTKVAVTAEGEIFNPVFRFVARLFVGFHGTIDDYLEALGNRFGEAVTPVHLN